MDPRRRSRLRLKIRRGVVCNLLLVLGVWASPAQSQEGTAVAVPPFSAASSKPDSAFAAALYSRFLELLDESGRVIVFEGRALARRFNVDRTAFERSACIQTRQLAARIGVQWVVCGSYEYDVVLGVHRAWIGVFETGGNDPWEFEKVEASAPADAAELLSAKFQAWADEFLRQSTAHTSTVHGRNCSSRATFFLVPPGFCVTKLVDALPRPRSLAVRSNGDVFVAAYGEPRGPPGGVYALRDVDGDGIADKRSRFGAEAGGHGLLFAGDYLLFSENGRVLRYDMSHGELRPKSDPKVVVHGLPTEGPHAAKPLARDGNGNLFVAVGSRSNVCEPGARGAWGSWARVCNELETRAGIWRFRESSLNQQQEDGVRVASGIRNAVAFTYSEGLGALYATVHGRNYLFEAFPSLYPGGRAVDQPAEELIRIEEGDQFGWPFCYFDRHAGKTVLSPEYGGDTAILGPCEAMSSTLLGFPAHWAPNGMLFYDGETLPDRYRRGAFIAFHGAGSRDLGPYRGYKIVFVPFEGPRPTGEWEPFMELAAPQLAFGRSAPFRPVGLAQGPDGSLYVSDDSNGTVWKVTYFGESHGFSARAGR